MNMARPSSQSPKMVSSFDEIWASTKPFMICSAVNTYFALNKYGFFRLRTFANFNSSRLWAIKLSKVIAQQVESVYPEIVKKQTSVIPDIYAIAEKCIL